MGYAMTINHHAIPALGGRKPIIFCDFDGTITESDNILAIMQHFDPPGWKSVLEQIISGEASIRDGVGRMFALLPSSQQQDILEFVLNGLKIRGGFEALLETAQKSGIEFFVTSGGIDFFINPILAKFHIAADHIFCNGSDFTAERIRITWPHPCDAHCSSDCGMCKTRIIRSYDPSRYYRIVIGDSLTDFEAAKLADLVFARSHLIEQCKRTGRPYIPFADFYDIVKVLKQEVLTQS